MMRTILVQHLNDNTETRMNNKPKEVKMPQSKKSAETKRKRAKSLTAEQIKELIKMWPDHSVDEVAANFGVSNAVIEKIAREVRKQNPEHCQKKINDLAKKVGLALRQLAAERKGDDQDSSPGNALSEGCVVSLTKKLSFN
jgi:hypothetical protein